MESFDKLERSIKLKIAKWNKLNKALANYTIMQRIARIRRKRRNDQRNARFNARMEALAKAYANAYA